MRMKLFTPLVVLLFLINPQAQAGSSNTQAVSSDEATFLSLLKSEERCHAPGYNQFIPYYPACKNKIFSVLATLKKPGNSVTTKTLDWYWASKQRVSADEIMQIRLVNQLKSPIFDAIVMELRYLQSTADYRRIQYRTNPESPKRRGPPYSERYQSIEELFALSYDLPPNARKYNQGWLHEDRLLGSAARLLGKRSELNRLIEHDLRLLGLDNQRFHFRNESKTQQPIPNNPAFWDTLENRIYRPLFSGRASKKALLTRLEKQVAQLKARYKEWQQLNLTAKEFSRINTNKLFIEYLYYQNREDHHGHYAAFTLPAHAAQAKIRYTDLGDADSIDKTIAQIRHRILRKQDIAALQKQLSNLLIKPLALNQYNTKNIVISTIGALTTLPFSLLLDPDTNKHMDVSYSDNWSILMQQFWKQAGLNTSFTTTPGIVLANPAYGGNLSKISPDLKVAGLERDGDNHWPRYFTPLAYTNREAKSIARLSPNKIIVLTGKQASEFSLFERNHPKFIHIASHGYFLSDAWQQKTASERSKSPFNYAPAVLTQFNAGLALAGANKLASGISVSTFQPDGLFTVMDASTLNLLGTELVVLSACNTGMGKASKELNYRVDVGDGITNLRTAFRMAGAKNVVMSLWPVADKTTAWFMEEFYRAWFNGQPPKEALQQAKTQLRKRLRKAGIPDYPYYWAGFVIQSEF